VDKAKNKKQMRQQRQLQLERKKKATRIVVWSLSICFVALIVLLAIFWPKPKPLAFDYGQMPTLGSPDAPVKLVEFGDYKCPACAYFATNILSKLKSEYIETGKVSISYQNFTIIYEDSYTAALAGTAIYHQSNEEFWKFNEALFYNQQADEYRVWATPDFLVNLARETGLNLDFDKLKQDIEQRTYASEVDSQNSFARKNKFTGTPTLLLNGKKLDASITLDYDKLKAEIDKALAEAGA
jgi:protein-disulfide isomerase